MLHTFSVLIRIWGFKHGKCVTWSWEGKFKCSQFDFFEDLNSVEIWRGFFIGNRQYLQVLKIRSLKLWSDLWQMGLAPHTFQFQCWRSCCILPLFGRTIRNRFHLPEEHLLLMVVFYSLVQCSGCYPLHRPGWDLPLVQSVVSLFLSLLSFSLLTHRPRACCWCPLWPCLCSAKKKKQWVAKNKLKSFSSLWPAKYFKAKCGSTKTISLIQFK